MRLLLALFVTATVCWPALAKSKKSKPAPAPKFSGELLSYSQLMALTKPKRMAYIEGVVEILILMENFNSKYTTAQRSKMQKVREQFAGLLQMVRLFPEAFAEDGPGTEAIDFSKIVPNYNGQNNEWSCPAGAVFEYAFGACLVKDPKYGYTYFEGECPKGTKQVPHILKGTNACIPETNWTLIPPERQQAIEKTNLPPPSQLRVAPPEQQAQMILGTQSAPGAAAPSGGGRVNSATLAPAATGVEPAAPPATAAPPVTGADTPASAKAPVCVPAVKACKQLSDADRETAIGRFRATAKYQDEDANVCVSGGFLSKYHGGKKIPSNCEVPRQLTFKNGLKTPLCASDEALCNPVLFCLGAKPPKKDAKFQPITFCAKKTGDRKNYEITASCASTYKDMLDGKRKRDPKTRKLLDLVKGAPGVKPEKCDPESLANELPIKDDWDEMIANTKKLRDVWCGESDFAALFCNECAIINDKIYKLNKDATESGCPEQTVAGARPAAAPAAGQEAESAQ